MITFRPLAVDNVLHIYTVANTPPFLFRTLRAEPTVRAFARANSAVDLVSLIKKIDQRPKRSPRLVALAYTCLVGLTFKEYEELRPVTVYKAKHLVWLEKLLSLAEQHRNPTRLVTASVPPRVAPLNKAKATNTAVIVIPLGASDD